jgi:tetratricopeptide (TPR) repeat protein
MSESPGSRIPGRRSTGSNLSQPPEGLPARFTANAPDLKNMNPTTAEEYYRRGWVYLELDEYPKAEEDFRSALSQDADNPEILYALGLVLKSQKKADEAVAAFERVLANIERITTPNRAAMMKYMIEMQLNQIRSGFLNREIS